MLKLAVWVASNYVGITKNRGMTKKVSGFTVQKSLKQQESRKEMKTEKETPGSLLAKMLQGDKSIKGIDFEQATSQYFAQYGIECHVKVTIPEEQTSIQSEATGKEKGK